MAVRQAQQSMVVPRLARKFVASSSQYLSYPSSVVGASGPFTVTMACWFRSNDVTTMRRLMCINNTTVPTGQCFGLRVAGNVGGDPLEANWDYGSSGYNARTTTSYKANTWHHACGVYNTSTDIRCYLDGGGKGTAGGANGITNVHTTTIGASYNNVGLLELMDGAIAHPVFWNDLLTDGEIAALATGISPIEIRPESIIAYWPFVHGMGDKDAWKFGYDLTANNSPTWAPGPPRARSLWQVQEVKYYPAAVAAEAASSPAGVSIIRPAQQSVVVPQQARDFDGSTAYAYYNGTPFTTTPFTFACWFKPDRATAHENLISIQNYAGGSGGDHYGLQIRGDVAGDYLRAHCNDGSAQAAISTKGITAGQWHHGVAVYSSSTDRRVYLDGGNKGTDATACSPSLISRLSLGALFRSNMTYARYFDGAIAHAAMWYGELTDEDVYALWLGANPLEIKRSNLRTYWPLNASNLFRHDLVGGYHLIRYNTRDFVAGPPRAGSLWEAPEIKRYPMTSGAAPPAGGATIPILMRFFRNLRT